MIVFSGRTSLQAGGAARGKLRWRDTIHEDRGAKPRPAVCAAGTRTGRDPPVRSANNSASLMVTVPFLRFRRSAASLSAKAASITGRISIEARASRCSAAMPKKQLFGSRNALGETIHIRDFPYTVVGVMAFKEQDSSYDGRDVTKIFVPFSAMIRDFPNKPPRAAHASIRCWHTPNSLEEHEECKLQIARALGRIHGFDPRDKEAVPVWDTVENMQSVFAP